MKILIVISIFIMSISNFYSQQDACKCCSQFHDDFDFWLGDWEVRDKKGAIAGYNTIEKIQNNCVVTENWKSAKGTFTGTSTNFYNASKQQWEQLWLDNQGGSLHLKGQRIDNKMILQSDETTTKDGKPFFHRITWTKNEDGTVRQYWEMVTNNNEISVAFDGLYKKVETE